MDDFFARRKLPSNPGYDPAYHRDSGDASISDNLLHEFRDAYLKQDRPLLTGDPALNDCVAIPVEDRPERLEGLQAEIDRKKVVLQKATEEIEAYDTAKRNKDEEEESRKRLEPLRAISALRLFPAPMKALKINDELREEIHVLKEKNTECLRLLQEKDTVFESKINELHREKETLREENAALSKDYGAVISRINEKFSDVEPKGQLIATQSTELVKKTDSLDSQLTTLMRTNTNIDEELRTANQIITTIASTITTLTSTRTSQLPAVDFPEDRTLVTDTQRPRKRPRLVETFESEVGKRQSAHKALNLGGLTEFDLEKEALPAVVLASISKVRREPKTFRQAALVVHKSDGAGRPNPPKPADDVEVEDDGRKWYPIGYEFLTEGSLVDGNKIVDVSEELHEAVGAQIDELKELSYQLALSKGRPNNPNPWPKPGNANHCVRSRARRVIDVLELAKGVPVPQTACERCVENRVPCIMAYYKQTPVVLPLAAADRVGTQADKGYYIKR